MTSETTSEAFFETKYRESPDPWDFEGSAYETQRYAVTLKALHGRRFRRAFEPGCSIGVLTARLAEICGSVVAMDISATAVEAARVRCQNMRNVEILRGALPEAIPAGSFDLIVFSEIGYYFDARTLFEIGLKLVETLDKGGTLLAVHWLGTSPDHLLDGDQVHEVLKRVPGLVLQDSQGHPGFRLDCWSRA